MKIIRERYLDDSGRWHLTIELVSRTPDMHSAMDALLPDERQMLAEALVEVLDKAARILTRVTVNTSSP